MTRQRFLLVLLLAWALVMIVPDLLRVATPLGSFGFYADNDGLIYDVVGSPITHPQITQRIRWYSSGGFRRVRSSRIARPQTATAMLYLISRLHDGATRLTDRYFNRALDQAEKSIAAAILKSEDPSEVDRLLADRPYRALKLASAASFRRNGTELRMSTAMAGASRRPGRSPLTLRYS